jgi:hypothetical protein
MTKPVTDFSENPQPDPHAGIPDASKVLEFKQTDSVPFVDVQPAKDRGPGLLLGIVYDPQVKPGVEETSLTDQPKDFRHPGLKEVNQNAKRA